MGWNSDSDEDKANWYQTTNNDLNMRNDRFWKSKKKLFHTLLVSQEPVLFWQEGLQLNQLLLVSGNPGIIFHFSHDLFWTYYGGSY